jgi:ribosome-binding factor A
MARPPSSPEARKVRLLKVGEQVRHVLSDLLTRQQVHDAVLAGTTVSVTEVRMTPDLRQATAYVKPLLGADEEAVLKALRTNTAYFQREVAGRLKLKYAAKVRFESDETFDEAARIEALLRDPKVARDLAAPTADESSEEAGD